MYCKAFLETGKCDNNNCTAPHLDRDKVNVLKEVYGDKLLGYYSKARTALKKEGSKGKGKGKGRGKGKSQKGPGKAIKAGPTLRGRSRSP